MKKIILFLALCVGLPMILVKCMESANGADNFVISDAYSYPTIGTMNMGVAFFDIANNGDKADAIIAAESPIASSAELHNHVMENGIMKMRQEKEVALPANKTVSFEAGGLHIMMFGLKQKLAMGDSFPLTLKLKSGTTLTTTVTVEDRE